MQLNSICKKIVTNTVFVYVMSAVLGKGLTMYQVILYALIVTFLSTVFEETAKMEHYRNLQRRHRQARFQKW